MVQPTDAQLITEGQIAGFVGADGNGIEWKKQEDGSYVNKKECKVPLGFDEKGKVEGEVLYTYSLTPKGEFLKVGVTKQKLLTKEQKEARAEEGIVVDNTPVPEKEVKKKPSTK